MAPRRVTADAELLERFCQLAGHVLELPAVRPSDNLFALGGTSVHALQLVSAAETELGVEFEVVDVATASSFRSLLRRAARRSV